MNCEHEGHGADVDQAVQDDQPGHPACLLLLHHLETSEISFTVSDKEVSRVKLARPRSTTTGFFIPESSLRESAIQTESIQAQREGASEK